ncbi:MAG: response regulator transcription factor [Rhodocyclaceae bacterium]|nr:response regulator transcription factor [Rhodocyclaceae bacterium]
MIRILLVDDHAVVRTGYRRLVESEPDMTVLAEAATADEAYGRVVAGGVDVAVVDLSLRDSSGIDAIRRMNARNPALGIIVLSMHDGAGFVMQAMRAGALGYLTKRCEPDEMLAGIRAVAAGRRYLSGEVAQCLAGASLEGEQLLQRLTPREFEVLRMAAAGAAAETIAERMHLSPKTILNHLSAIRRKLDADNDFALMHLAARHGLVRLDQAVGA